jgi:hypothetical protein
VIQKETKGGNVLRKNQRRLVCVALGLLVCGLSVPASGVASSSGSITASSFTQNFSVMSSLKSIAAKGKGKVAVILPDTVSSARYTEFDAPYLKEAFTKAGLSSKEFIGASVLVVDPLDSGVGAQIESYAKAHGVKVIDYDRLTLGGSRKYYVSFNNVKVGTLLGQGLVSCVAAWKVKNPQVIVMRGDPTDNNATLFAQGYDAVLAPLLQVREVQGRRQPGRHLDADRRGDRVPAGLHRAPEHQRGADPERRERRADHHYLQARASRRTPSRSPARTRR